MSVIIFDKHDDAASDIMLDHRLEYETLEEGVESFSRICSMMFDAVIRSMQDRKTGDYEKIWSESRSAPRDETITTGLSTKVYKYFDVIQIGYVIKSIRDGKPYKILSLGLYQNIGDKIDDPRYLVSESRL